MGYSIIKDGGDKWIGFAVGKLNYLLKVFKGTQEKSYKQADGTEITVSINPNKIEIVSDQVYVTVTDRDGTVSISPLHPLDVRGFRFVFLNTRKKLSKPGFYALGNITRTSGIIQDSPYPVGISSVSPVQYWHGKGGKAMSWTNQGGVENGIIHFCISGDYYIKEIPFPPVPPIIGSPPSFVYPQLRSACYANASEALKTAYPSLENYPTVIASLWTKGEASFISVFGFTSAFDITAPIVVPITLPIDTKVSEVITGSFISGFGSDAMTVCCASYKPRAPDGSYPMETNQKIFKLVFNETYSAFTQTIIYEKDIAHATRTITGDISFLMDGEDILGSEGANHEVDNFVPGEPIILHIKQDVGDGFCALRYAPQSYSHSHHYVFSSIDDPQHDSDTITDSSVGKLDVIDVFTGLVKVESPLSTLSSSYAQTYDSSTGYANDESSTSVFSSVSVYSYSAVNKLILAKGNYETFSYAGSSSLGTFTATRSGHDDLILKLSPIDSEEYTTFESGVYDPGFPPLPLYPVADDETYNISVALPIQKDSLFGGYLIEFSSATSKTVLVNCYGLRLREGTVIIDPRGGGKVIELLNYRMDRPKAGDIYTIDYFPIGITEL